MKWIDVDIELPKDDNYVLISFTNFSIPVVGRYEEDAEGGAFHVGDDAESCVQHDLFVNAWMPLPKPYRPEEIVKQTNADCIRAMSDEELADKILSLGDEVSTKIPFCGKSALCDEILDKGELIPEGLCKQCLMNWLRAEVDL